jgi:hypothetical protein
MIRSKQVLLWVTLFSISMGYLESAVVVYLREIMYPAGFTFPMVPINERLAYTELFREIATLVMLCAIGTMAGRTRTEKFAYFIYSFAIWDGFYYVFLKAILNWPGSLFTWDILFLIPVTWTGPVIAPLISSLSMVLLATPILILTRKYKEVKFVAKEWIILVAGAVMVFFAYIWDYARYVLDNFSMDEIWSVPGKEAMYNLSVRYVPVSFNWILFLTGEGIIVVVAGMLVWRISRNTEVSRDGTWSAKNTIAR